MAQRARRQRVEGLQLDLDVGGRRSSRPLRVTGLKDIEYNMQLRNTRCHGHACC